MADPTAAEMNTLAGERAGEGGVSALDAWKKKVAGTLDGPLDDGSTAKVEQYLSKYGTLSQRSFPPPAPSDNLPVPNFDGTAL
jgi:hypothetical protein